MEAAVDGGQGALERRVWDVLATLKDPEIPAISLVDLGVIGSVSVDDRAVRVEVLPTFVGCPAVDVMRTEIREALEALEVAPAVDVEVSFTPPWTSDRITEAGRERLRLAGFAPPRAAAEAMLSDGLDELAMVTVAECPFCGSRNTVLDNPFGPTPCRAIHHCQSCRQPFEQFKTV
jgi:ring-1,2-phenylacetyl-CoA epoxidase subunit PaaD